MAEEVDVEGAIRCLLDGCDAVARLLCAQHRARQRPQTAGTADFDGQFAAGCAGHGCLDDRQLYSQQLQKPAIRPHMPCVPRQICTASPA